MNNENENLIQVMVITKYSSYTEAQKRAIKKYRENNREKINELHKKYYENQKENDPQFLEKKRERAKEYYKRKKENIKENNV